MSLTKMAEKPTFPLKRRKKRNELYCRISDGTFGERRRKSKALPFKAHAFGIFVIPVASRADIQRGKSGGINALFAVDGDGFLQAALDTNSRVSCRGGKIVWYNYDEANVGKVVFGDTSIDVTLDQAKGIWLSGNYKWYAW